MQTRRIEINIPGERMYCMRVGEGLLDRLGDHIREAIMQPSTGVSAQETLATQAAVRMQALVITDSNVAPLYLARVKAALHAADFSVCDITVPAGEDSKSLSLAGEIWEAMAARALGRDCVVVALGGGVVGDLAGFVASTYMRGVSVVQVPTTLLSMVDSSVGGKTAVNLSSGKNLVGTFYQPRYVCADTSVLTTLDTREWTCGCGEIAKSAAIDSDDFFFWLCSHASLLAARDASVVVEAITRSVVFKARVVAQDKSESKGVRECLNYGHTLAHAIENAAGYGTYSHGAAVAEGMRFAARLGAELRKASPEFVNAQDELLDTLGLPALEWSEAPQTMLDLMKRDKKVRGGALRFVLPRDVGDWELREVSDECALAHLRAWQEGKDSQ